MRQLHGEGDLLEVCKKFKFDHLNKWYMYNPEYILENKTQNSLGFWNTKKII